MAGLMWNIRATVEKSASLPEKVRKQILEKFGAGCAAAVPAILEVGGQRYEIKVKLTQGKSGNLTGVTAARTPATALVSALKEKPAKAEFSAKDMAAELLG